MFKSADILEQIKRMMWSPYIGVMLVQAGVPYVYKRTNMPDFAMLRVRRTHTGVDEAQEQDGLMRPGVCKCGFPPPGHCRALLGWQTGLLMVLLCCCCCVDFIWGRGAHAQGVLKGAEEPMDRARGAITYFLAVRAGRGGGQCELLLYCRVA